MQMAAQVCTLDLALLWLAGVHLSAKLLALGEILGKILSDQTAKA
jgi:hypothetical protein